MRYHGLEDYLERVSEEVRLRLVKQAPERYLKYISEDSNLQLILSAEDPEVYLKHASKGIQYRFMITNLKEYLKHAAEEVQRSVILDKSVNFDYASEAVKKAIEAERKKPLQHAADESKEEHKNNEFLAMELLQEDRGFLAESKQSYDNVDSN